MRGQGNVIVLLVIYQFFCTFANKNRNNEKTNLIPNDPILSLCDGR